MTITYTLRGKASTPIPFTGSAEVARANYETHAFGAEGRCWNCDCRPWGEWAKYQCGTGDRHEERFFDGSDGSNWREMWEIRGDAEIHIFTERIDQPAPEGE
jgi:hypothetical protein